MNRSVHKLVLMAAVVAVGSAAPGSAQQAAPPTPTMLPPIPGVSDPTLAPPAPALGSPNPIPDFQTGWPRPSLEPPSLFRQAPVPTPYGCDPVPGRYFERDPLLDPPSFPQPGFVASVDVQALVPHIYHDVVNVAPVGSSASGSVAVPVSGFSWAVSPRIEFGYRLGSGFGEFAVNYQFLETHGSSSAPFGPDGPAGVGSKFQFNLADFDYVSRQFTPWERWGLKWRIGLRTLQMFYNTTLTQPFDVASAGSGIFQQQGYNAYHGYGGHVGVEVDRDLGRLVRGLSFVGKLDVGSTAGFIKQTVTQTMVDGTFTSGTYRWDQASPSIYAQLGLNYHVPGSRLDFYLGGSGAYWWNVGKNNNVALNAVGKGTAGGDLSLLGATFRLTWNY